MIRDLFGLKERKISKRKRSTAKTKPKDTLKFYRKRLGFKKPSTVLVDGSVLYFITVNKLSFKDIKEVLKDDRAQFVTTNCVLREMEVLYHKYSGSAQLLKSIEEAKTLDVVPCMHQKEVSAEQCIRSVVWIKSSCKMFVAVVASCSWPLVHKDPTIPIIIADNGTFDLKQLSSHEQRLAKKWCADYPIEKATIKNKDLNISPNFRRLRSRIKFYGCVGKIAVDKGGNGQFKLLSYPKLYLDFVEPEGPEDDVHLAYLEYVNSVSRDGERGDEYTMQAAADFFQVMFVVITSLEGCAVNEFLPYGMVNVDPEKVLYLSCLYLNDEKHYNILHRKSTIASTCRFSYTLDGIDLLRCKSVYNSFLSNEYHIIGSSNGLVCISPKDVELLVTNPLTREVNYLPTLPDEVLPEKTACRFISKPCWGFGYDSSMDDYKVIVGFGVGKHRTRFHVLTLKSNIWKLIGDIKYKLDFRKSSRPGILCEGSLHWFMNDRKNKKTIISFDLSLEEFKEIPQPDDSLYKCNDDDKLGFIEESLCIYKHQAPSNQRIGNRCIDTRIRPMKWIMRNYQVTQSWEQAPYRCEAMDVDPHYLRNLEYITHKSSAYCRSLRIMDYMATPVFVPTLVSPPGNIQKLIKTTNDKRALKRKRRHAKNSKRNAKRGKATKDTVAASNAGTCNAILALSIDGEGAGAAPNS
ncbi:F-box/kelch-repeat protein-like protein [Tanacetum coccineum]